MTAPTAQTKIFISYRRAGESGFVRSLASCLGAAFGTENVFRDVSGLRSGEDFESKIGSKLSEASVVVAVIGGEWVGRRRFRRPRIQSEGDWVRREIEHALASGTPVIPVLIGEAALPAERQLPASLRGLLSVHAARIRDDSWDEDCSKLVSAINEVARGRPGEGGQDFQWRRVEAGKPGRPGLVLTAVVVALAALAGLTLWPYLQQPPATGQVTNPGEAAVNPEDPATWVPPQASEARSPVAELALRLALLEMQASTREAGGQNAGFNVSKFTERFGPQMQNAAWSGAFVTWCYLEALKRTKNERDAQLPFTDSAANMRVAASLRERGWLVEPFDAARARPGDIVFFRRTSPMIGHAEIVYAVSADKVCSIGGNVNNQVSGQCRPVENQLIMALGAVPREAFEQPPPGARGE